MQIALFQPDIPQNTGTILRLCACLNVAAHIIEPAGFPVSDRHFRRAGMDYLDQVAITRHDSWQKFEQWRNDGGYRLILFTTKGIDSYLDHRYGAADILLFGRESAGGPRRGRCCRRRAAGDPDQARLALAQYRDGGGDGIGRGASANQFRKMRRPCG
jgi:tRNA (cytidine/uridine-2'-O-)-methyltransferase